MVHILPDRSPQITQYQNQPFIFRLSHEEGRFLKSAPIYTLGYVSSQVPGS